MIEKITQVQTHDAKEVSTSVLWLGHTFFGGLVFVAIVLIVFARGPRRRDAIQTELSSQK